MDKEWNPVGRRVNEASTEPSSWGSATFVVRTQFRRILPVL